MKIIVAFWLLFAYNCFAEDAEVKNLVITNVDREIDLSSQLVKENLKLEIENGEKSPVKYFVHAISPEISSSLAYVEAFVKKSF